MKPGCVARFGAERGGALGGLDASAESWSRVFEVIL
jgi:hypothetical protein